MNTLFSIENKARPHLTDNKTWLESKAAETTWRLLTLITPQSREAGRAQSLCVIFRLCIQSSAWLLPGISHSEQGPWCERTNGLLPKHSPPAVLEKTAQEQHSPVSEHKVSPIFSRFEYTTPRGSGRHCPAAVQQRLLLLKKATEKTNEINKKFSISNFSLLRFLTPPVESSRVGTGTWVHRNSSAAAFLQMCNELLTQNKDVARTVVSNE